MDNALKTILDNQIKDLERQIENTLAQEETVATQARRLRSISGIGPVSAAMLIAERPELGRMTAGKTAAMTGLALLPRDSRTRRGRRRIVGGRQALRHVLFQVARAAADHDPALIPLAKRLKEPGKPHKLVIAAMARKLVTIANAVLKTGAPWRMNQAS